ncbi:Phosphatidate cytidylyltransferase [Pelomyxa schiedti]|nr:Phosphatidate cytidylyltransferase [Pelomyxa schiedti]
MFPGAGVEFAMAYGSAVLPQATASRRQARNPGCACHRHRTRGARRRARGVGLSGSAAHALRGLGRDCGGEMGHGLDAGLGEAGGKGPGEGEGAGGEEGLVKRKPPEQGEEEFGAARSGAAGGMVDIILGVNNAVDWHRENMEKNWSHYSVFGYCGPRAVAWLQKRGPGLYYMIGNTGWFPSDPTNTQLLQRPFKYGVIEIGRLQKDLLEWDSFYASGRMQKPFVVLKNHDSIMSANSINIANAVRATLLMLPQKFTEEAFYRIYAGLSYIGDTRLSLCAENPNKVSNIVKAQITEFRNHLWGSPCAAAMLSSLKGFPTTGTAHKESRTAVVEQDCTVESRLGLIMKLPKPLLHHMFWVCDGLESAHADHIDSNSSSNSRDPAQVFRNTIEAGFHAAVLQQCIASRVGPSSTSQTLKGIVSAGLWRSTLYASSKVAKFIKG